jgi:hypothetical protein
VALPPYFGASEVSRGRVRPPAYRSRGLDGRLLQGAWATPTSSALTRRESVLGHSIEEGVDVGLGHRGVHV